MSNTLTQSQVSAGVGDIGSLVKLDDGREGHIIGYMRDDSGPRHEWHLTECAVDVGGNLRDVVYLDMEVTATD
jgi:hypothetical protein